MKKQNLILFVVLAAILGLGSMGTYKAGSGHVEVVEDNVKLVETNNTLKEENKKLTEENSELKGVADSLVVEGQYLKEAVTTLETKVDDYEVRKENVVRSDNTDDEYIKSYTITIPIPEISDSTN